MKLLSVLFPTYNRLELMKITLNYLLPQIERNSKDVEFIIGDNVSTDGTGEYADEICKKYDFASCVHHKEHTLTIGNFTRTIEHATGKYVILWGDDDIPMPYAIDYLVECLKSNPDLGLLHFNVLRGKDRMEEMDKLFILSKTFKGYLTKQPLEQFIYEHGEDSGFTTSIIFDRDGWNQNIHLYDETHYGFEFLPIMFRASKGKQCGYISCPLVFQRMPLKRAWYAKWPLYALVGMPNIMRQMDKEGITSRAEENWRNTTCSFIFYIKCLLAASSYKKENKPLCSKINEHQKGWLRHFLTYFIIYCIPGFVNNLLRKLAYKR